MRIHLSGSPGTGKTTLGKKLKKLFPYYMIVETDSFVTSKDRRERDKIKTVKNKIKFIFDIYKKKFNYYNKKYKNIIYIGILNSSVPNGKLYKTKFDYNIFYNIKLTELIKRYYTREVKNGILTKNKYLKMVADGSWDILSGNKLVTLHKEDINEHEKMGYKLMTEDKIINFISKLKIGGTSGEVNKNKYEYLFDNIQNSLNIFFKNNIKNKYETKNNIKNKYESGKKLYDLIFKNIYNIKNINKNNLYKVWYQGNTQDNINNSVTAGIPGLHIYIYDDKKILGIVLKNNKN